MTPAERAQLPSCAAVDAPQDACTACERDDGAKCWVVSEALEHGDLRAKALFNARGCELGHVRSCMDLGQAYKRGVLPRPAGVHGVLLEESACREARARCIAGDLAHCATAAGCDRLGHGTTTRRLRRQVVAACDNGHGDACTELAIADPARHLEWTRRGCDGGSTWACTDLGSMQAIGLDPQHGRSEGLALLARTCEQTGFIEACEAARGYLDWRWYREMHGGAYPDGTFAPMRARGEVHGPAKPSAPQTVGRSVLHFCVDRSGAVERAESVHSSGHPETDTLYLALIRKWRLEPRTTAIQRCWSVSVLTWFSRT